MKDKITFIQKNSSMKTCTFYIKNMCCERCIVEVKRIFENAGVAPLTVRLGEVVVTKTVSPAAQNIIIKNLEQKGFSLVFSEDEKLVVNIQALLVFYMREYFLKKEKLYKISNFLARQLNKSYTQLSKIFKKNTGITIEKYFIKLKVEKAKELLILNQIDMAEIAWLLGYSSSQNFSTQFKIETGKTPGEYRIIRNQKEFICQN